MKKTIIALLLSVFVASVSFAATSSTNWILVENGNDLGTTSTPAFSAKGSKGVSVAYLATAQGYVIGASHSSGTQTYASSSGDTKIFKADGTRVAIPTTAPSGTASASFGNSFSAM